MDRVDFIRRTGDAVNRLHKTGKDLQAHISSLSDESLQRVCVRFWRASTFAQQLVGGENAVLVLLVVATAVERQGVQTSEQKWRRYGVKLLVSCVPETETTCVPKISLARQPSLKLGTTPSQYWLRTLLSSTPG